MSKRWRSSAKWASQRNTATCLLDIAIGFYDQGDLAAAQKMYEEALSIQREIGDKDSQANTLNSIANVLADKGNQAGAKAKYEEALAVFRETGSQFEIAMTMSNIGELYLDEGDLPKQRKCSSRHCRLNATCTIGIPRRTHFRR